MTTGAGKSSWLNASCGGPAGATVGGMTVANELMQPIQDLRQIAPLLSWDPLGGPSAPSLWQMIP